MSSVANARFVGVAGYYTPADRYRHGIVATAEGRLFEIFFKPSTGKGQAYFGVFPAISGLAGFYTPDDGFQHLIVARPDGFIEEVYFKPNNINFAPPLLRLGGIIGIDAFYAADNGFRHVIVATNNGDVHEIFYHPSIGVHLSRPPLVNFAGLVAIAAFYTPDDNFRHVIVATQDGNLREVFYHPSIGLHITQPPLANFGGIVAISAFYTPDDKFRHVIVATNDGNIHEVFYHPSVGVRISHPPLANFKGANAVAGFYTDDDRYRHVIVGTDDGDVFEIFYSPRTGSFVSRPPLGHFDRTPPSMVDLGPDSSTATNNQAGEIQRSAPAGQITRIAGDAKHLYVTGTLSGVWRSTNGGRWQQLPGSPGNGGLVPPPPLATDPASSTRVVVGARDGAWESTNAGATWTRALDPTTLGCVQRLVRGTAFTQKSTLVVGTECGVARRAANGVWSLTRTTGPVTALVASENQVWARTQGSLLFSTDDGATWSRETAIPNTISFRYNEFDSLGAIDGFAYMVSGGNDVDSLCGRDNRLVVFSALSAQFKEQSVKFIGADGKLGGSCDGTGSGVTGHKFLKTFVRADNLPAVIGKKLQLFYCAGQEILQADGINADGTVSTWTWIMGTSGYTNRDPVHADPWDFTIDTNAGGAVGWVCGDGGVFAYETPVPYSFAGASWIPTQDGLHAHQVITMSVLQSSPISRSRIAYPASHDNAWIRTSTWTVLPEPAWDAVEAGGDVNWGIGESSSPRWALLARQLPAATLVNFHATPDRVGITLLNIKSGKNAMGTVVPLATNIGPAGPLTIQFVPQPKSDGRPLGLDMVMVVDLPLTKPWDGTTNPVLVPNSPLASNSNGQPVLIRNKQWHANADINASAGNGWAVEIPSFPANAIGFFVSGNRASPVFYTFTQNGDLLRWNGIGWGNPILSGLAFDPGNNGVYGPVFVNPYDRNVLYALTPNAVVRSVDGGGSFAADAALTALVTSLGRPTTSLAHMAFNYEAPNEVAAGGATGLFFSAGGGKWTNLTSFMPSPVLPAIAVGIDSEFIYVTSNGRSPVGIRGYKNA